MMHVLHSIVSHAHLLHPVLAHDLINQLAKKWAIPVNGGTPPQRSKLINLKGKKMAFWRGKNCFFNEILRGKTAF